MNRLDVMQQFMRDFRRRKAAGILRAMSNRRNPANYIATFFKKVERRSVQSEEFQNLAQRAMQRVGEVQGFGKSLGDRVQNQQFAVAPPDFLLRSLAFGDVKQEALISRDCSGSFAYSDGRFHYGANFAVARAKLKFVIGDGTVFFEQFFQTVAVMGIYIE